ncbi:MAG: hypothetical protein ACI9C2_002534, partial [Gammaproteobacteria bacterium]
EAGLFELRDGYAVVVPGELEESELWFRIHDDEDPMPPEGKPRLSQADRELLERWIQEGAPWREHWSLEVPTRPAVPTLNDEDWGQNELDRFLLEHMASAGLSPNSEAPPETLARRASLDLTGLPPELEELDAFLVAWQADADRAWSDWLDAQLDKPAHAEHMAAAWLDVARYADSNGYEKDDSRSIWSYRDWVIDAFDSDMPFDEFTRLQLAGDLLPNATTSDQVATGFHRNTMINGEGGTDPEEFRVAAVLDRVDTTGQAWLGTTVGCAKCHSHRYDPISHQEYYSLFAFFNGTEDTGNSLAPTIAVAPMDVAERLVELDLERGALLAELEADDPELDALQTEWEARLLASFPASLDWETLHVDTATTASEASLEPVGDGSWMAAGELAATDVYEFTGAPADRIIGLGAIRLEALPSLSSGFAGRAGHGNFVLSEVEVEVVDKSGVATAIERSWAQSSYSQRGQDWRARGVADGLPETGWAVGGGEARGNLTCTVNLEPGARLLPGQRLRIRLRQQSIYGQHLLARVRLSSIQGTRELRERSPVTLGRWLAVDPIPGANFSALFDGNLASQNEVLAGYDPFINPADKWREAPELVDGVVVPLAGANQAFLFVRELRSERAQDLALRLGSDDGIKVWLNGGLVHSNGAQRGAALDQDEVVVRIPKGRSLLLVKVVNGGGAGGFAFLDEEALFGGLAPELVAALGTTAAHRDGKTNLELRLRFRQEQTELGRQSAERIAVLDAEAAGLRANIPTTPVMRELDQMRPTHVLFGANFLAPSVEVEPDIPAAMGTWPEDLPRNRLGLADWLVSADNPLTARVVVNRAWAHVFGTGLVATEDDFGAQGELPTHPELLDWLAVEFRESGWDLDHLYKLMLESSAYRQSSRATAMDLATDPGNRLLARGPRMRLSAEGLRDVALASAGLLDPTVGGMSVFPPQPDGTWAMTYSGSTWVEDSGPNRWRRGMYTYRRRTAPYPTFALLDAPSFELTCTGRSQTNTPLQALALLNDPAFVEAAAGLARLVLAELPEGTDEERIQLAFRRCTSRVPSAEEQQVLGQLLTEQRNRFVAEPERATALAQSDFLPPVENAIEAAAWTLVANVLLNLDEVLTKQ